MDLTALWDEIRAVEAPINGYDADYAQLDDTVRLALRSGVPEYIQAAYNWRLEQRYCDAPALAALRLQRKLLMNQLPPSGSVVLVTPVSYARICCVRRATVAACSVGRPSVSSIESQCSDWQPPRAAAMAW